MHSLEIAVALALVTGTLSSAAGQSAPAPLSGTVSSKQARFKVPVALLSADADSITWSLSWDRIYSPYRVGDTGLLLTFRRGAKGSRSQSIDGVAFTLGSAGSLAIGRSQSPTSSGSGRRGGGIS